MRPVAGYGRQQAATPQAQSFIPAPQPQQYRYQNQSNPPPPSSTSNIASTPQSTQPGILRQQQQAPSRPPPLHDQPITPAPISSNSSFNSPAGNNGPGSFAPRAPIGGPQSQAPRLSNIGPQTTAPSTPMKATGGQFFPQNNNNNAPPISNNNPNQPPSATGPISINVPASPQINTSVVPNNNNNQQIHDLQRTILQLQTDLSVEKTAKIKYQNELAVEKANKAKLQEELQYLHSRLQEQEQQALHERKLRLEIEATIDRLGLRQHIVQPNLRRASSSLDDIPPPPPPQSHAPHRPTPANIDNTTQKMATRPAQLSISHDGQTIKSPTPSGPARPVFRPHDNDEENDDFNGPPPSLGLNTFAPPSASNDQRDMRLDSRRAITSNTRVDQQQALSPLEDDWTFDNNPSGFLHQHEMNQIIQYTLDKWTQEFRFSKDVKDFMLLEIADIVENAPSEQLMKKQLERYHYELMTSPYQLVRKIGAGGFGSVYQGVEKSTSMPVAIKVISLEDTEDDVMVITREITALVQGHTCPQLIRYYGSDVKSTKLWIVMEYVNGGSLLDHIKMEPLAEKYIAIVAREVLLGLQYLNQEGKIHRDIKAANILIGTEGSVKLADFGASRALNDTMSKCNTFVGSPYWMSPDVITQHDYDGKADVWSLGITCIELAQGKPPHTNVNPMAVLQVIIRDPPPQLHGNFSKDFKDFVAMCLVKDPQQRASVVELLKSKFIKNAKKTRVISELFGGEDE